jgi:hypothetical protein
MYALVMRVTGVNPIALWMKGRYTQDSALDLPNQFDFDGFREF